MSAHDPGGAGPGARGALSRRTFIGAAVSAGGLALCAVRVGPVRAAEPAPAAAPAVLGGLVRVAPDGAVTALTTTVELGQGAHTTLALVVAEELELDPAAVAVEMAPVTDEFMVRLESGAQYYVTWGSLSSRDPARDTRRLAATVRLLLVRAAAAEWRAREEDLRLADGSVRHADGRALSFGALASRAAALPVPQDAVPKPRAAWRRLGHPAHRCDAAAKVDGSARYGIDVRLPRMAVATIAQCPVAGGRLESVDAAQVLRRPGVVCVVPLDDAVAVVAADYWQARQALELLAPVWRRGATDPGDRDAQLARLRAAAHAGGELYCPAGTTPQAIEQAHAQGLARAARRLRARYEVPFLAHAPLEPMNATAHVTAGGAELWVPTQFPSMVRDVVAERLALPRERVLVHPQLAGGGFGRRIEVDYAVQAALIAAATDRPVKLVWSREEDMTRGYYRPMAVLDLEAGLDAAGLPTSLACSVACPPIMAYTIERRHGAPRDEVEEAGLANAMDIPYALPTQRLGLALVDLGVPVTWLRSVGAAASAFALESFVDELAAAARVDALRFRLERLSDRPRERAALLRLSARAELDRPAAPGLHRGVALNVRNGTVVALAVELEVDGQRRIRLRRVTCVVDCGVALNPDAVIAQMEGGIVFGLTAACYGEITFQDGRVTQRNFDSYRLLSIAQTPPIAVEILSSQAPVGGVGEEAVPAVAPALCNALCRATGHRPRSLPLVRDGYTLAAAR